MRIDPLAKVTVVGRPVRPIERDTRCIPVMSIACHRQRAETDAVKAVGKGNDVLLPCDIARDLESRLNCISTCGPGELHHIIHAARLENRIAKSFQELALSPSMQIQTVGDSVLGDVVKQSLFKPRIVVPVIQGSRTGKKIKIPVAFFIV
jgi:hypothetical protein